MFADTFDDETVGIDVPYDAGARLGMFDKCNGKARMTRDGYDDTTFNRIFFDGYDDAYDGNERRI